MAQFQRPTVRIMYIRRVGRTYARIADYDAFAEWLAFISTPLGATL